MRNFQLEILSPERAFYIGDCVSLTAPVSDGMIGIMAGHTPLTAAIMDGEVIFTTPDGVRHVCAVSRGMLDVSAGSHVRILSESALAPEEIDEEKERQAMQDAMLELSEKQGRKDYMLTQQAFARAFNNLKVKQHNAMEMANRQ